LLAPPETWKPGSNTRITLEQELVDLQLQEAKLRESLGPAHPDIQGIRRRIEAVHGMLVPSAVDPGRSPGMAARPPHQVAMQLHLLQHEQQEAAPLDKSLNELLVQAQEEAQSALLNQAKDEALRQSIERSALLYETVVKRLQELDSIKDYGGFDTEL